jgi:hypothetical protein
MVMKPSLVLQPHYATSECCPHPAPRRFAHLVTTLCTLGDHDRRLCTAGDQDHDRYAPVFRTAE